MCLQPTRKVIQFEELLPGYNEIIGMEFCQKEKNSYIFDEFIFYLQIIKGSYEDMPQGCAYENAAALRIYPYLDHQKQIYLGLSIDIYPFNDNFFSDKRNKLINMDKFSYPDNLPLGVYPFDLSIGNGIGSLEFLLESHFRTQNMYHPSLLVCFTRQPESIYFDMKFDAVIDTEKNRLKLYWVEYN